MYRFRWLRVQVFGDRPCFTTEQEMKEKCIYADAFYISVGARVQATEGRPASPVQLSDDSSDAVTQESLD